MSHPREPDPGQLLISALLRAGDPGGLWPDLVPRLETQWGPIERVSAILPFDHTDFYRPEMGAPLVRRVVAFEGLVPLERLVEVKLACLALEDEYRMADGCRRVNLDPGMVTPERLVLATCKNFTHRVYLGRGVWADLTLVFVRGDWMILPWTFPDYAAEPLRGEITTLRALCLEKLRAWRITSRQREETPCR